VVHHRYPFDRLLILQAKAEGSTLVSSDVALDLYAVPRIW
jgi:PIN domain nuclease of toxin-antitoxin system